MAENLIKDTPNPPADSIGNSLLTKGHALASAIAKKPAEAGIAGTAITGSAAAIAFAEYCAICAGLCLAIPTPANIGGASVLTMLSVMMGVGGVGMIKVGQVFGSDVKEEYLNPTQPEKKIQGNAKSTMTPKPAG